MLDELLSRLLNGLLISQVDEGSNVLPRSINGIFCVCSVAYDVGCCSAALDDEATSIFVFSAGQFCITTARDVLFFFQGFQILAVICICKALFKLPLLAPILVSRFVPITDLALAESAHLALVVLAFAVACSLPGDVPLLVGFEVPVFDRFATKVAVLW